MITIPLSFSQERLLFIDQYDHKASSLYHGLVVLRLKGILSKEALSLRLKMLLKGTRSYELFTIENGHYLSAGTDQC